MRYSRCTHVRICVHTYPYACLTQVACLDAKLQQAAEQALEGADPIWMSDPIETVHYKARHWGPD